jgi:hypothetical protein
MLKTPPVWFFFGSLLLGGVNIMRLISYVNKFSSQAPVKGNILYHYFQPPVAL